MRRWLIRLAVVAALVLAAWALRRTVLAPQPLAVKVARAARGRVESTVTNSRAGTVKARRRAQISPEIGSRSVAIPHRDRDTVTACHPLLRLHASVLLALITLYRRERQAPAAERQQPCTGTEL